MRRRTVHRLNEWVRRLAATADPAGALLCFPPAGGGASMFHPWLDSLPGDVDLLVVQPPAREDRSAEPAGWTHRLALARTTEALQDNGIRPAVVFGHSLGALVAAHFVAGWPAATQLVASAAAPDGEPPGPDEAESIGRRVAVAAGMTDLEWEQAPPEVRDGVRRRWVADLRVQAEVLADPPRLTAPVAVWGGVDDPIGAAALAGWRRVAPVVELRMWPGDHRYPFTRAHLVVPELARRVCNRPAETERTP